MADEVLLLHMDGPDNGVTFIDETGKIVSTAGNVCTKTGQKKFGTASAYFDGTGDYLTIGSSTDFAFGTGDFTIDGWIYPTIVNENSGGIFSSMLTGYSGYGLMLRVSGLTIQSFTGAGAGVYITLPPYTLPSANSWYHIAIVRFGNTLYLYVNGIMRSSISCLGMNLTNTGAVIGSSYVDINTYIFTGYIDELRVSKGIAQWTANFTPPIAPYQLGAPVPETSQAYCFVY